MVDIGINTLTSCKRYSKIYKRASIANGHRGPDTEYVVEMYEDNTLVETRVLPGKSVHYAQDVSENWDNGLIKRVSHNEEI